MASKAATDDDTSSSDSEMQIEPLAPCDPENPDQPTHFDYLTENIYLTEPLTSSRDRKRAKRMVCDCQFDPELDDSSDACGDSCLNRLLMIECGSRCPCGEYCTNKRFQKAAYAPVEVFKTDMKGWGLRAITSIGSGCFVMEYCGEVCTPAEFEQRKKEYVVEKRRHYYFMSLKTDEILDATRKGNLSRFINHSCDPNCETQKWTVNGRLRVGFFSVREMATGEELTFDYQFQRFGDVAQKCFCGSDNCRGYLGAPKQAGGGSGRLVGPSRDIGSPTVREGKRRKHRAQTDEDSMFEKEVYDIVGSSWRLRDSEQVIAISRIMLQAETPSQRIMLLQVLQATEDATCLRKFLSLHGLRLLWSWMVDSADSDSPGMLQFRTQVLQTLSHLPVTTKNQLEDSKILPVVMRWVEKGATAAQEPPENAEPADSIEGTVVTEADSAPCETEDAPGGVAEGVTREDEGSCEAEARESSSATESQDESGVVEEKLVALASELLEKWSGLKEVFRIPKRAQPLKKPSREQSEEREGDDERKGSELEGRRGEGGERDRRGRLRGNPSPESSPTWSRKRRSLLPTPTHSPLSTPVHSPLTPRNQRGKVYNAGQTSSTSYTSNTGFATAAPVQNTVIVQQHGQSVYVQQQVFQDGCQTTILPAQYVQPSQPYLPSQVPLSSLQPLPQQPTIQQPAIQQPGIQHPGLQHPGLHQPAIQQPSIQHPGLQHTGIQQIGIQQPGLQQPTIQHPGIQQPGIQQPSIQQPGIQQPGLMALPQAGVSLQQGAVGMQQQTGLQQQRYVSVPHAMAVPGVSVQQVQQSGQSTSVGLQPAPASLGSQHLGLSLQQGGVSVPQGGVGVPQPQSGLNVHQPRIVQYPLTAHQQGTVHTRGFPQGGTGFVQGFQQPSLLPSQPALLSLAPLPPPPPGEVGLPPHWRTAKDPQGKVYYYHTITRKSQWDQPTEVDAEGTITMDLGTPEHERSEDEEEGRSRGPHTPLDSDSERQPHTPEGSPPPTPTAETDRSSESDTASPPPASPSPPPPSPTPSPSALDPVCSELEREPSPQAHTPTSTPPHSPGTAPPDDVLQPSPRPSSPHPSLPHPSSPHSPSSHTPSPHPSSPHPSSPHSPSPMPHTPSPHPSPSHPSSPHPLFPHTPSPHKSPFSHSSPQTTSHTPSLPPRATVPVPSSPRIPSSAHSTPLTSPHARSSPHPSSSDSSPSTSLLAQSPQTPPTSKGDFTPPPHKKRRLHSRSRSKGEHNRKEAFRHKLSKVVTHCLDRHRKPDCKYGRITCSDDFKYLARKLTYGLVEKEISRKGGIDRVVFSDSVKSKVKDYIRQYMKKAGPIYGRT